MRSVPPNRLLFFATLGCAVLGLAFEGLFPTVLGIRRLAREVAALPTVSQIDALRDARDRRSERALQISDAVGSDVALTSFFAWHPAQDTDATASLTLDARIRRVRAAVEEHVRAKKMELDVQFAPLAAQPVDPSDLLYRLDRLAIAERAIRAAADAGIAQLRVDLQPSTAPNAEVRLSMQGTEQSVRAFLAGLATREVFLTTQHMEIQLDPTRPCFLRIPRMTVGPVAPLRHSEGVSK